MQSININLNGYTITVAQGKLNEKKLTKEQKGFQGFNM